MALQHSVSCSTVYSTCKTPRGFSTAGRDCWTARKLKRRRRANLLQTNFMPTQATTTLVFDQNNHNNRNQQVHKNGTNGVVNRIVTMNDVHHNHQRPTMATTTLNRPFNFQMELSSNNNMNNHQLYCENLPVHEQTFINNNGTVRSSSTVTTPASMVDDYFNYSEKLNGSISSAKLKAFSTSSGAGSLSKHFKHHKVPAPHRTEIVFKAINNALNNCISVTQQDMRALHIQCDNVAKHGSKELFAEAQRQAKAAERYLKRLEFHFTRVEEVQEQYEFQLKSPINSIHGNTIGSHCSTSRNVMRMGTNENSKRSPNNSHSLKNGNLLKELSQILTKLEAELELLLGTLSIQLKGLVGFARLAPGDVFEVNLKCGNQKWKSKGRVGLDRNQVWDADLVIFRCLLEDMLDIKVAEVRTFGKSLVLIEKSFDPIELFSPHPQLMTVDLNRNGSLKLDLIATWNPLDGLLTSLSRSDSHWSLAQKPTSPVVLKPNYASSSSTTNNSAKVEFNGSTLKYTSHDTGSLLNSSATNMNGTLPKYDQDHSATLSNRGNGYSSGNGVVSNGNGKDVPPYRNDDVPQYRNEDVSTYRNGDVPTYRNGDVPPYRNGEIPQYRNGSSSESILHQYGSAPVHLSHNGTQPANQQNGGQCPANQSGLNESFAAHHYNATNGNSNNNSSSNSLLNYLRQLKYLLQMHFQTYPELQNLDQLLNNLYSIIKVSSNGTINRSTINVENALGCFDFLRLENGSGDIDDLDNNILNGSSSMMRNHMNGNGNSNSSNDGTPRARRYLKKGELSGLPRADNGYNNLTRENGFESTSSTLPRRHSCGPLTVSDERSLTTGSAELDLCFCHHFQHCEQLLDKLKNYGPLHHRKQEALFKLNVETAIIAQMINLVRNGPPLPKVTEVFAEVDASTDLQDIWLSACGSSQHGYYLSSALLKQELKRAYNNLVSVRYPDLVDKVFDKVLHLLSDRSSWNVTIISVYQFVFCFKNKHLPIFIESLAHETWIIENLRSRSVTKAFRVMERLKQVPVPPPPDCLRHIGAVLTDEMQQMRATGESYLLHAQGALREDLVNTYLAFLEHEDPLTRQGACRALAVLQARRCINALVFVSSTDHNAVVREDARKAVLSFGAEGKEALKNLHSSKSDMDITRV